MSKSVYLIAAAISLAAATLSAQSTSLRVTVPFEFVVGQSSFPAGDYTVMPSQHVVQLRRNDGTKNIMILANSAQANRAPDSSTLVFRVYNDHYFLSAVWAAGNAIGQEIPKSRAERDQIAAHRPARTVTLAATLR